MGSANYYFNSDLDLVFKHKEIPFQDSLVVHRFQEDLYQKLEQLYPNTKSYSVQEITEATKLTLGKGKEVLHPF